MGRILGALAAKLTILVEIEQTLLIYYNQLEKASVLMERLSYLMENVLSNKIIRNRIVLSFKDSPRVALRRRPITYHLH